MKRFWYLLALESMVMVALVGCEKKEPANELERIREAEHLYVGMQPVNDPFGISSGTQIIGFDADLAQAISHKMNVPIRWVPKPFEELFDNLTEKKADLIISVVSILPERKEKFAFSEPYFQSGQIVAIRKDSEKEIKGIESLKGKKVGVQNKTAGHIFAQNDERLKAAEVIAYPTVDSALLKLNEREVDAVIAGFPVLVQDVEKSFPNLTIIGRPLTNEQKAVVLRKGEEKLLQLVNETISEMKSQGKLEEMGAKWFKNYPRIKELQSQVPGTPLG
ncbi:MAG: amino acid ABC transporter substrate-binding protein [Acidobacteria bacterium]|nr:amino acid ABC transporter substrate-binding protein [Acidobacteriota bacterium]